MPLNLQHISDNELWLIIISGDVAAYTELYERYWETFFETAYWHLYDKAAAKDLWPGKRMTMACRRK